MKMIRDNDLGIMFSILYNYKDLFNIDLPSKEEALSLYNINYQQVMLVTEFILKMLKNTLED